jgi:class III poly(R)-hydroxyalkanoic acid synthase PhaE subunit
MSAAHAHQEQSDWFRSQQEYWQQMFQTQQSQWTELFGQWQKGVPGADGYRNFFTQGGQQFLEMMQAFQKSATENTPPGDALKTWAESMKDFFGKVVQGQGMTSGAADSYKNFMNLGENMVKAGQAWASVFQDKRTFEPGGAGFANYDPFGFFASMPGIGYSREKQEEYAKLYRLWHDYEQVMKKYNASMATVGIEAAQRFQDYVFNPPKDAPPLTSLKSIYVKWVDICEDIYAKYAVSQEYTGIYGETVNALMAFKKQFNKITDDVMDELNLPTRKEVDALHQRVHELRREVIELRKSTGGTTRKPAPKAKAAAPAKKAKGKKA